MGLFTSYCKTCHKKINWFLEPKYGFIQCDCGEYNSHDDLLKSLEGPEDYQRRIKLTKRLNKIKKLKTKYGKG